MKSILYLTDYAYPAKGRRYCDEDLLITDYLRGRFLSRFADALDRAAR